MLLKYAFYIFDRDLKRKLARDIIKIYYNEKFASQAEINFDKIFIKKDIPDDIPTYKMSKAEKIVDVIHNSNLVNSKSEIKRLIKQGAVKINEETVSDIQLTIDSTKEVVVKIGKRKFLKIIS